MPLLRLALFLSLALALCASVSHAAALVNGAAFAGSVSPAGNVDTHTVTVDAGDSQHSRKRTVEVVIRAVAIAHTEVG